MKKAGKKRFLIAIFVFALVFYLGYRLISQQFLYFDLKKQESGLLEQIDGALEEKQRLESQQEKYNTKEFIESVAREDLGLVYPDEKIFMDTSGN